MRAWRERKRRSMRHVLWCVAVAAAALGLGCGSPPPEEIAWHLVDVDLAPSAAPTQAPSAAPAAATDVGEAPQRPPGGRQLRGPARAVIADDMRYTFPRPAQLLVARDTRFAMPDAEYFAM